MNGFAVSPAQFIRSDLRLFSLL